jgi:imidazolonepropionase-like amidohydrolase
MRALPFLRSVFVSVAVCALIAPAPWCAAREQRETLAIVGATAYLTPSTPAIQNSVVLIVDGKIEKIGERRKVRVPKGATVIDAAGLTLVAGFWNCHVHLSGPQWKDAAHQPADKVSADLQRMLTRFGFTTVFDIASVLANTNALRTRVESGEVLGPRIFTTGEPIFPKDGVPIYVQTGISTELYEYLERNAEAVSPGQATAFVDRRIANGADAIKIFAGSWLGGDKTIDMPIAIIQAVTSEAHRSGKLVFAHPQTRGGLENSVAGGVDILAHTAPTVGVWDDALLAQMKLSGITLIPTLKLWHVEAKREGASPENAERFINAGVEQLRAFIGTGGRVLFGTDVGYIDEYDTTEEFELMAQAGMGFSEILTSLTTAPVARLGKWDHQGRIAPGFDADLVLLKGDPAADVKNFANVKYTIRAGKVICQGP